MADDAGRLLLTCRGCGGPVRVGWDVPLVSVPVRRAGEVYRGPPAVRCPACAAALDGQMRREFPDVFGGES